MQKSIFRANTSHILQSLNLVLGLQYIEPMKCRLVVLLSFLSLVGCGGSRFEAEKSEDSARLDPAVEFQALSATTEGSLRYYDHFDNLLVGVSVLERNGYLGTKRVRICRKMSAVSPGASATFSCYNLKSEGQTAKDFFSSFSANVYYLVGSTYRQGDFTSVIEKMTTDGQWICQNYAINYAETTEDACFKKE